MDGESSTLVNKGGALCCHSRLSHGFNTLKKGRDGVDNIPMDLSQASPLKGH